jgi:hypothetical protein
MTVITTIVTGEGALKDFRVLLFTLEQYYKDPPTIYVFTDSMTVWKNVTYKGILHRKETLDEYQSLNRGQLERIPGRRFKTRWTDFMCEKINVLRWAFNENPGPEGIWFLDADITLFGPLPSLPEDCDLGLSPHFICSDDEAKYGHYNGGFLWMKNQKFLDVWEEATKTSRFYEQAALEAVATTAEHLHEFPIQVNFGWWRLSQSTEDASVIQSQFGFNRNGGGVGLTFRGLALGSVHTHWGEKTDFHTSRFNKLILKFLETLGKHKPAAEFRGMIRKNFD